MVKCTKGKRRCVASGHCVASTPRKVVNGKPFKCPKGKTQCANRICYDTGLFKKGAEGDAKREKARKAANTITKFFKKNKTLRKVPVEDDTVSMSVAGEPELPHEIEGPLATIPKGSPKGSPKAASPRVSPSKVKEMAQKWANMYFKGWEPPHWSLQSVGSEDWNKRAKMCRVYAASDVNRADLAVVVSEREPVNVTMERKYKPIVETGYSRLYRETKKLPPNFAIYMPALMSSKDKHQLVKPKLVHVINSIGFAFDSDEQPDYDYFMANFTAAKKKELCDCVAMALKLAFQCTIDLGLKKICLCYLGGKSFATLYKPKQLAYRELFFEALEKVLTPEVLAALDEISILGYDPHDHPHALMKQVAPDFKKIIEKHHKKCRLLGYIPGILSEDMLFMNAWDPHSVVGNGNQNDDSLDGYFGRLSDMGYMSIPELNPHLLKNVRYV